MIGLDFALGLVLRPVLAATGVLEVIRVDMILPIMMMLITRLVVDKYGTLILYEFVFGILAILAEPASFGGIPGFLKIIPAVMYGVILDSLMSLLRTRLYPRLLIAGVIGGTVNLFCFMGIRLLFGMPWSRVVQVMFGINLATTIVLNVIAVHLAYLVWKSVVRSGWVDRIQSWRTS